MDEIVAAAHMRDFVLAFTRSGKVFRFWWHEIHGLQCEPYMTIPLGH